MIKKVVVTGPTGAVGVALINELINNDIFVYAICRPSSKRIKNIPISSLVKIIECDISNYGNLRTLINDRIDVFYHFAWDGTYGKTRDNELVQYQNILHSIDAVNCANDLGCKVFIGAGSQSEYGCTNSIKKPYDYCNPNNFYGAAKLSASILTRIQCAKYNIRHNWCRIFSLFGPCDGNYTMVMSSIVKMMNGELCEFTKGEQLWDYIYSKDAAVAFRLIAEKGTNNSIYNIATGKTRLLKDFILEMHSIVNKNCNIKLGALDYYEHQPMNLTADISNLVDDTGFVPKYSFADGIREIMMDIRYENKKFKD